MLEAGALYAHGATRRIVLIRPRPRAPQAPLTICY
jgi:hypothetical protein